MINLILNSIEKIENKLVNFQMIDFENFSLKNLHTMFSSVNSSIQQSFDQLYK